jgi:branched-chain amino acid transport system substrate-binding protein
MKLLKLLLPACLISALPGFIVPEMQSIQKPDGSDKTVKIGLLISDNNSLAAKYGAELAIRKANENGGYNGKSFQLVVRSMEGPWGTGSKEAVNLIFEENVCALMGSCDGRNAHLVEQVTTKARIVFLSALAGDPTLAQAFVPWYFSCVPNDLQQADALIEEIYNKRRITITVAISSDDYDSKLALESFMKRIKPSGNEDPVQILYDNSSQDFSGLIDQISKADVRGIILFGKPSASMKIIQQLHQRKINQPVFGTLSLLNEDESSDQFMKYYEDAVFVASINLSGSKGLSFREEFQKIYGKLPGAVAAYSFDGMSLLIEAIKSAGTDREKIQKALAKIQFEGVTGLIKFDDKGKRIGTPLLMEIKNGLPVAVER